MSYYMQQKKKKGESLATAKNKLKRALKCNKRKTVTAKKKFESLNVTKEERKKGESLYAKKEEER